MNPNIDLKNTPILSLFISYFVPSFISMIVLSTYVIVDGIFIGKGIGENGLAAVSICMPIFSFFVGLEFLFGIGGAALSGMILGANKKYKARVIFCSIIYFSISLAFILGVLLFIFRFEVTAFLGVNENMMEYVMPYFNVIVLGGAIILAQYIFCSFARNDRAPNLVMISFLAGSVINIILNYIFIFVLELGMLGASLSTILGHLFALLIVLKHFIFKNGDLYFIKAFNIRIIFAAIKSGIPPSMGEFTFAFIIILMNVLILKVDNESSVAVLGIIVYMITICFAVILAISHGLQPIVSYNFGSKNLDRVLQAFKIGMILAFIIGALIYLVLYFCIPYIGHLFLRKDSAILGDLIMAVRIYFLGYLLVGFNVVIGTFLQAIGKIRGAVIVSLSHNLIFMTLLLPIFAYFFGVIGIWSSFPVSLLCSLVVSYFVLKYEMKTLNLAKGLK